MNKKLKGYYAALTLSPKLPLQPMADDRAKAYMLNRIIECAHPFGVDLVAYLVTASKAGLLLGNRQGIKASLADYADCLNGEFSEYYNQTFQQIGMVFSSNYNVIRLKSKADIKDCVCYLHFINPNGDNTTLYPYSSYPTYLNAHPYLTYTYSTAMGAPFNLKEFVDMHERHTPLKDYMSPNLEKLSTVLSEHTTRYGPSSGLSKEEIAEIIANTAKRTQAPFDKIYKKLRLSEREKNEILLHTLVNLTLEAKYHFYDATELLEIEGFTDELIIDTIAKIRELKGYSLQYTKHFLGL